MGVTVRLSKKNGYLLPNKCIACGAEGVAKYPIMLREVQFVSHSSITFYVCSRCAKYTEFASDGGIRLWSKEFNLLPLEEKKRDYIVKHCVGMKIPFFYVGKVEFSFYDNDYGVMFWKLNGGDMREFNFPPPEFK